MIIEPDTPIVVGASQVVNRPGDSFRAMSATDLMTKACRAALHETGAPDGLAASVGEILVPHGTWPEADPGRAVAHAIGAAATTSIRSELGVSQYTLLSRAATAVAQGRTHTAVVVGAENRWSDGDGSRHGTPVPSPPDAATTSQPDEVLQSELLPIARIEIDRHLTTPAYQYAIIESAYRHHVGHSIDNHQRELAALWGRMAVVAAESEYAWNRPAMAAHEIVDPSPSNRLIAAPYRKWMVSQWNVDQAAALVITSVRIAQELGIPEALWVFPLVVAISDDVVTMCERAELHRWPAAAIAARTALDASGVALGAVSAVDLYSCFPVAVEIQAAEIGLPLEIPLTITGGMTFAGGPYNNYSLQGIAAMVEHLRKADSDSVGLTTAVSGFLTKPAVALWSRTPRSQRFSALDVSAAAAASTERRAVDPDYTGAATVVGATVVPTADDTLESIAVVESAERVRTVVLSDDQTLAKRILLEDPVGWKVAVEAPGRFGFGHLHV